MATKKKAPKRSKSATKRKSAAKPKSAKSATAKSKPKSGSGSKSKSKSAKRKTASKSTGSKKKSVKTTGRKTAKSAVSSGTVKKVAQEKVDRSNSSVVAKKRHGRVTKMSSRNSAIQPVTAPPPKEKALPKTRLNDKQLGEFKQRLLEKRRMLTGDVRHLTHDALRRDGAGDLSNMPIHMADIGSDNWEQEFTLGLIENEQQLVREIDYALARIGDRTYGVCVATGKHIGIARLRAKPWAKYCIEYARQQEIGR